MADPSMQFMLKDVMSCFSPIHFGWEVGGQGWYLEP